MQDHGRQGDNAYTTAIRTVGEILQDYDYGEERENNSIIDCFPDKKILGLGFSASEGGGAPSHCFNLLDGAGSPYCKGVEGLLQAYRNKLKNGGNTYYMFSNVYYEYYFS